MSEIKEIGLPEAVRRDIELSVICNKDDYAQYYCNAKYALDNLVGEGVLIPINDDEYYSTLGHFLYLSHYELKGPHEYIKRIVNRRKQLNAVPFTRLTVEPDFFKNLVNILRKFGEYFFEKIVVERKDRLFGPLHSHKSNALYWYVINPEYESRISDDDLKKMLSENYYKVIKGVMEYCLLMHIWPEELNLPVDDPHIQSRLEKAREYKLMDEDMRADDWEVTE